MCFLVACVTEPDRSDPGSSPTTGQVTSEPATSEPASATPDEQASRPEATDDDFIAPDAVTGLLPASVTTCIKQCDGDEGCIECCRCAHPTQCCF
ncbi:MAG: hypothetical protein ABIY55_02600 [Kofleriaceae bacterium]